MMGSNGMKNFIELKKKKEQECSVLLAFFSDRFMVGGWGGGNKKG